MLHHLSKSLCHQELILWASAIRVLPTVHHLRQMLSMLTWRSSSHLHDVHSTTYFVPNEDANRWYAWHQGALPYCQARVWLLCCFGNLVLASYACESPTGYCACALCVVCS